MTEMTAHQKFAEKMFQKDSRYIPEILKCLVNDEQADLLVSMPGTVKELADKLGRPAGEVETDLKEMFYKGLAFKKVKGDEVLWRGPRHLMQFHDATILWPEVTQEFLDLWAKYMEEEWPELARIGAKATPRPGARVVAVNKSIETGKAQVLAPDDVTQIVEGADKYAVTKCTCRLTMKKCDGPIDVCLQFGRGAEYAIERGSGREVTRQEALDILKESQDAGLVHVTMNRQGVGYVICNCCGCCCYSFPLVISEGLPMNDPSRFQPEVETDSCSACGDCEERCWFEAICVGDDDVAVVNEDKCMGCGQCAIVCSEEAITMIEAREPGFIPE